MGALALALVGCATTEKPGSAAEEKAEASASKAQKAPKAMGPPRYKSWPKVEVPEDITTNDYGRYDPTPKAPRIGDTLLDFELLDHTGATWSTKGARLDAKGPMVVIFYRGFW